jgi:protein KRI1
MPKRKADNLSQASFVNSNKKVKQEGLQSTKKPNLLDDSDSDSSSEDGSVGGAKLEEAEFKVNEEYAEKFEYNKKREELHRCQSVSLLIIPTLTDWNCSRREI